MSSHERKTGAVCQNVSSVACDEAFFGVLTVCGTWLCGQFFNQHHVLAGRGRVGELPPGGVFWRGVRVAVVSLAWR